MIQSSGFFVPIGPLQPADDAALEVIHESEDGHCILLKGHRNDRIVVYKALKPAFRDDPVHQRMLHREYEIGATLQHPGICQVLDWKTLPKYGDSIEMEWIDGCTLGEWLDTHRQSRMLTRKVLLDICDAVEYIHRKQVIHKGLKPENILVTRQGDHIKIIDFGLSDTDSILTGKEPGGTWKYAAPEVLSGEAADERSDIYSLGIMIREAGPGYAAVARKCIAANPNDRFPSAEAVRQALLRKKRSWLVPIIAAVLLLVAAVFVLMAIYPRETASDLFLKAVQDVHQAATPS